MSAEVRFHSATMKVDVRCTLEFEEACAGQWGRMNAGYDVTGIWINDFDAGQYLTNAALDTINTEAQAAIKRKGVTA